MNLQQGDVKLFQTDEGGDLTVVNGVVEMAPGLETMAYLCLFGGNEGDDGRDKNPANWWGNLDEDDPARRYRSETQNLLRSLPATSGNLKRVRDAALRDLNVFKTEGIASSVEVSVTVPGLNRISIIIDIEARGEESRFEFAENWKATR